MRIVFDGKPVESLTPIFGILPMNAFLRWPGADDRSVYDNFVNRCHLHCATMMEFDGADFLTLTGDCCGLARWGVLKRGKEHVRVAVQDLGMEGFEELEAIELNSRLLSTRRSVAGAGFVGNVEMVLFDLTASHLLKEEMRPGAVSWDSRAFVCGLDEIWILDYRRIASEEPNIRIVAFGMPSEWMDVEEL